MSTLDRLSPRVRQLLPAGIIALLLVVAFGPTFVFRMRVLANPLVLSGDARQQIFPFFRYYDVGTFANDYSADYFLAVLPIGYRAVFTVLSKAVNPAVLGKALSVLLLIPLLGGLAVAAKKLAGYFGVFATLALALSCPLYMERMAGGLPRSFAYPLVAVTAAALVLGRMRLLAGVVLVAAAFCPTAAVPAGMALAMVLFLYPASERGEASSWSVRRRFAVVAGTAVLAALIVLPSALTAKPFGRGLAPADAIEYPEIGPEGRYGPNDRAPYGTFSAGAITQARRALKGDGKPFAKGLSQWVKRKPAAFGITREDALLEVLLGALALGSFFLVRHNVGARRLFALLIAAWAGFFLACGLAPYFYLPARYISYNVPMLVTLLLPAAGAELASAVRDLVGWADRRRLAGPLGVAVAMALCLIPLGGRGDAYAGLMDESRGAKLYHYLEGLPKDAVIAGWPDETMNDVPYVARRQAFHNYEAHQVFIQGTADEMRRRMRALTAAYFATDPGAIGRLRDDFRVTHMIVNRHYFTEFPTYFKPFDDEVRRAEEAGSSAGFELLRQLELPGAVVFSDGDVSVIDLSRLGGRTGT